MFKRFNLSILSRMLRINKGYIYRKISMNTFCYCSWLGWWGLTMGCVTWRGSVHLVLRDSTSTRTLICRYRAMVSPPPYYLHTPTHSPSTHTLTHSTHSLTVRTPPSIPTHSPSTHHPPLSPHTHSLTLHTLPSTFSTHPLTHPPLSPHTHLHTLPSTFSTHSALDNFWN